VCLGRESSWSVLPYTGIRGESRCQARQVAAMHPQDSTVAGSRTARSQPRRPDKEAAHGHPAQTSPPGATRTNDLPILRTYMNSGQG
jgi:hypothetical protein